MAAGLLLLTLGGEYLVRGASHVAAQFGVRPLVAGLTIVAFGTSAPELAVSLDAALEGFSDVAVGSVVGSNICNIALILGLSAVISPVQIDPRLFRFDLPVMLAASVLLIGFLLDGQLGGGEAFALVVGVLAYTWWSLRRARDGGEDGQEAVVALAGGARWRAVLMSAGGLVALAGGGYLAVHGGVELATEFGVSNAVIALTVVAVGTSLPELFTTVVAAVRSQGDIAVGNVVGSNIFNILCVLGITALVHPLSRGGVGWFDIGVMFALSVLVVPLAWSGLRLGRLEGLVLLLCYATYTWWRLIPHAV
jgi:cation:H+ antiporter